MAGLAATKTEACGSCGLACEDCEEQKGGGSAEAPQSLSAPQFRKAALSKHGRAGAHSHSQCGSCDATRKAPPGR